MRSYSSDFRISDKFFCQGDGISPPLALESKRASEPHLGHARIKPVCARNLQLLRSLAR
jgi:hypothetical protein